MSCFWGDCMKKDGFEKSRNLFIVDGSCANAVFTLTTGAFLSGFASSMGASPQLIGIIAALPTLLNVTQVFSSLVFENRTSKKNMVATMALLNRLLLAFMFFIPVLVENKAVRLLCLTVMYAVAYFFNSFIGTAAGNWLLSLVSKRDAGKYLGKRDSISLAVVTVVSLAMGRMLDSFRESGREQIGFIIIGVVVFGFALLNFYSLSNIKEPEEPLKEKKTSFKEVVEKPLKDKKFRKVIGFYTLWNVALNVAGPFFSIYMVVNLKLDYFYIVTVTLLSSIARVVASVIWGKLADKISWLWVTRCSIGLLGIVHASWMLLTPSTCIIMMPFLQIASGIAWGGIAISTFNIQYAYAPVESRVSYVSLNTAITGLCGFLATLVGSGLLSVLKEIDASILMIGTTQQLFLISGIGMGLCVVYLLLAFPEQEKNRRRINIRKQLEKMYNYKKYLHIYKD